jgi:Helix-turn-helix
MHLPTFSPAQQRILRSLLILSSLLLTHCATAHRPYHSAFRGHSPTSGDIHIIECGVHRTYVGQVERSERNISLATLELFANAMSVSVPQLLTKDGVK